MVFLNLWFQKKETIRNRSLPAVDQPSSKRRKLNVSEENNCFDLLFSDSDLENEGEELRSKVADEARDKLADKTNIGKKFLNLNILLFQGGLMDFIYLFLFECQILSLEYRINTWKQMKDAGLTVEMGYDNFLSRKYTNLLFI